MTKKKKVTGLNTEHKNQDAYVSDARPKASAASERLSLINFQRYQALFLALLVLVGFIIYSNTFHSPFVFDDRDAIADNTFIRMDEITSRSIIDAATGYGRNRPVAMLSFAINYYLGKYNVIGYHLVNILIHIANGILLFLFLKLTLTLLNRQTNTTRNLNPSTIVVLSFFAALLWLVNPVQTQSVTYIVQRMNSMGAMFYLLALILYAKGRLARQRKLKEVATRSKTDGKQGFFQNYHFLFGGCFLAGFMALGCKESTAVLPLIIFLYEWYFFQDLDKKWFKRQLKYAAVIAILLVVVAGLYVGFNPAEKFNTLRDYSYNEFSLGQRLLTQTRVVIYYLSLIFYPNPSRLNLDYDFPLSYSLLNPFTTLLSLLLIVGLMTLGLYLARKQRLISFCIFWFFGNLVIESSVIPLAIIYEHRLYLPSMAVILLAVILFHRYLKPSWLPAVIACAAVALCSFWTFERNHIWQDTITLWADCVRKSPNKARPYTNLAQALTDQKRYDEALPNFLRAIHIDPNLLEAQYNLGNLYDKLDKTDKAIEHYRKAVHINPNFTKALNNLGAALLKRDNTDEAIKYFQRALQIDPKFAAAHINLGAAFVEQDKIDEAIVQFNKALQVGSNLAKAQFQLGDVLIKQGRTKQGIILTKQALQNDPDYAEAHNNLGGQLLQQGKLDEALEHLTRALSINPELTEAHNNVGIILIQQGKLDAAISHFQEALRIDPDFALAKKNLQRALAIRQNRMDAEVQKLLAALKSSPDDPVLNYRLGNLYLGRGELNNAVGQFEKALALKPKFPEAQNNLALAYAAGRQYDRALAAFTQLIELDPDNPSTYYNIAVLYALQNEVDDAVGWLKKAVAKGYHNWELIKTDKDLANIRHSEDYQQLVKGH